MLRKAVSLVLSVLLVAVGLWFGAVSVTQPQWSAALAQETGSTYQQGYLNGYRLGFRNGQNFQKYSAGYHPERAYQLETVTGNADYKQGHQAGFFKGFDDGYYGKDYNPTSGTKPSG